MRTTNRRLSDQSDVWEAIGDKMGRMEVASSTLAMSDVFDSARPRLEEYTKAIVPVEWQVGALFAIDGRISGLDLFDSPETLRKLLGKLVLSHALDAVERPHTGTNTIPENIVGEFLRTVSVAEVTTYPALGLGTDLRFQSQFVAGGALTLDERLVHLCAFPVGSQERKDNGTGRMTSSRGRAENFSVLSG